MTDSSIINHGAAKEASAKISQVIKSITSDALIESEIYDQLITHMQKPTWRMMLKVEISGEYIANPINLKADLMFDLDTSTLFEQIDYANALSKDSVLVNDTDSEVAELVKQASLPQSLGRLTQSKANDSKLNLASKAIVIIKAQANGAWIDASDALLARGESQEICLKLDRNHFSSHVYVALDLLRSNNPFTEKYLWQDKNQFANLTISIDADFSPL